MRQHFSWQSAVIASDLESSTKLVLLVIGSFMNQHGTGAFPSYQAIAKGTSLNRATVIKHVDLAVAAGWLTKTPRVRKNPKTGIVETDSNLYAIGFPAGAFDATWLHEATPQSFETTPLVAQDDPGGSRRTTLTPHL